MDNHTEETNQILEKPLPLSPPEVIWKGQYCAHKIVPAFVSKERQYFNLYDGMEVSCERGLDCLLILEEMDMRCTADFLKVHTKKIEEIKAKKKQLFNANPIKLIDIYELEKDEEKLNNQLKERLDFVLYPKLIKKLASYFYFDETENPYVQNQKYAEEKIQRWEGENLDFFLLPLTRRLIEPLRLSTQDLGIYSQVVEKIDQKHLENLYLTSSENLRNNPIFKELISIRHTEKMSV